MASRKKYSREFKLQAARLVVERGHTYREVAERLGANAWSVRDWVSKFRAEGALPGKDEPVPEAEELKSLRRENADLRVENEILKKAAAYFAKECL